MIAIGFWCRTMCDDPHWLYEWNMSMWNPLLNDGDGGWDSVHVFNQQANGQLGCHGGMLELPGSEAEDWWNEHANKNNYDITKGMKIHCSVKCLSCTGSASYTKIIEIVDEE